MKSKVTQQTHGFLKVQTQGFFRPQNWGILGRSRCAESGGWKGSKKTASNEILEEWEWGWGMGEGISVFMVMVADRLEDFVLFMRMFGIGCLKDLIQIGLTDFCRLICTIFCREFFFEWEADH